MKSLIIIFLIICTITDLKERKVNLQVCMVWMLIVVILNLYIIHVSIYYMITGILPGVLLLLVAVATKEKIGIGDGIVIVVLGVAEGFVNVMQIAICSLILCIVSVPILMAMKKYQKDMKLPFIPYLALSYFIFLGLMFYKS